MIPPRKYVLTAGPSAGKSSTIRELAARGHRIAPEGARVVLDQLVSEGINPKWFRENYSQSYQDMVIESDFRIAENTPDDVPVFMDRSAADSIAYTRLTDRAVPDQLMERCQNEYGIVFLLDQINFSDDYARTEDEKMAKEIHEELHNVYKDLGHTVVSVPVMPVDERADYIENRIEQVAIH